MNLGSDTEPALRAYPTQGLSGFGVVCGATHMSGYFTHAGAV